MAVIKLYLNNEWVEIEPYNAITFDFRYDEVFDSGKFTFESTTIDYNIPPCTLCKVDNEFWFVSSICNKIIPSTSTYIHDAELLEATFALHQVIIGTKMLSNNGNYPTIKDKIGILLALANQKCSNLYGTGQIVFAIDWTKLNNPNLEREFQFGKGTSLFQALLEIGKSVNCIPYVFNIDLSGLNALIEYQIGWINLNDNNLFELEDSKIIKIEMYQDVENYTQILESEIDNVVDRDTINYVYNLTVTSNDAVLSSNNQILKLPSNIESIVSMQINSESYGGIIRFKFSAPASLDELYGSSFKTLEEWNSTFDSEFGSDFVYQAVLSLQDNGFNISMNSVFYLGVELYAGDTNVYYLEYASTYPECKIYMAIPITDRVLEYSQWCMLDAPEQNKYFVYTKYSDTIENLYQRYKDDLYNEILGNNAKEPLYYAFQKSLNYSENLSGVAVDISVSGSDENTDSTNPINSSFNIAYKPVVSTFIKSTNNKSPFNESAVKSASKSFELSSSLSDFNLLVDSINKVNDMTGMPELTIEYNGSTIPNLGDYIIFKNKKYYITSMQQTILLNDYTTYINLVSSFNKVAEVFGVASQYESTINPIEGIVDRIVYFGEIASTSINVTGIAIQGVFADGTTSTKIYVRGATVQYDTSKYLIVRAVDAYAITTGTRSHPSLTDGYQEVYQYSYVDSFNECKQYKITLARQDVELSVALAKDIAVYSNYTALSAEIDEYVFKDARERLIFVIKII